MSDLEETKQAKHGRNFIGGLVEGYSYPMGKKIPLVDILECNDIIIVDRLYFLQNKRLIEAWALDS